MCGDINRRDYPAPLQLNGRDLPFVTTATHLGHELCQDCTMDQDAKIKRAGFIDRSTSVRETFSFAEPMQVISAVGTYCCDHYGSMLWPLYGQAAEKYYRCYNTCVKLAWNCPRSSHTYFVTNVLTRGVISVRIQIMSRYVKYVQSLLKSRSPEVVSVANKMMRDMGSTTGSNMARLQQETGLNIWSTTPAKVRQALVEAEQPVPETDLWRVGLLEKLLAQRRQMEVNIEDTKAVSDLIDSLCSS